MKRRALIFLVIAVVVVGVAVRLLRPRPVPGFATREVISGQVYSGGQPSGEDLGRAAATLGVRTVVNLRGTRASEKWYQAEQAACQTLGLEHHDVRVKTDDWPPQHEVRRFVHLLDSAPRPLLLHCKNGVDRSGWGSAVALALAGLPLQEVLAPLSATAGHVCVPATCPLHRFFALYQGWLDASRLSHDGPTFRRWALQDYCPEPYDALLAWDGRPPGRSVLAGERLSWSVHVTNRSAGSWRLSPRPDRGIRLGIRALGPFREPPADPLALFRTPGNPSRDLGRAGMEEGEIRPGASRVLTATFAAPAEPGLYVLQVDMVDELVHWFSDLGAEGILIPLEVKGR